MDGRLDPSAASEGAAVPRSLVWRGALVVFLVASAGYALVAWDRALEPSPHFHFVDLAQSFMSGRLDTDTPRRQRRAQPQPDDPRGFQEAVDRALTDGKGNPVGWNDWASYRVVKLNGGDELRGVWPWKDKKDDDRRHDFHTLDGAIARVDSQRDVARSCGTHGRSRCDEVRYFISFPPLPAVLMAPFVAVWGYDFNDVVFTVLLAGLNAALMFALLLMLRARGYLHRPMSDVWWFTALFAFGTVVFFSSVRGEVWFTALVVGLTFHIAYVMAALDARHPLLAGLFLGLGFAARTPLLFATAFFATQLLWPANGEKRAWRDILWRGAQFAIPTLAAGVALLAYNYARFENPLEFGHSFLAEGTRDSIREHGLFSMWFVNRNLQAALVNLPVLTASWPFVHITRHGLSLLVTTPSFLWLASPRAERSRLRGALWASLACVAIPALMYQNTGWAQFGYRFSLDFLPYLMLLLATDRRPVGTWARVAIALAIVINLFGAITFGRAGAFYYD